MSVAAAPRRAGGFTLIELTIVLVVVGLLMGGVLKGQELITSARVRQLVAQQEGHKAAYFGLQDRFRAFPGDYAGASRTLNCAGGIPCANGNGIVELDAFPVSIDGAMSEARENLLAWTHLASAGFLKGSYVMASGDTTPTDGNSPKNPFNVFVQLGWDAEYADLAASHPARHNLKTGAQIPVEILAEIDRKTDDGNAVRGAFRHSTYRGNAAAAPPAPAAMYGPGQCASTAGTWYVAQGELNCGGASLL